MLPQLENIYSFSGIEEFNSLTNTPGTEAYTLRKKKGFFDGYSEWSKDLHGFFAT